MEDKDMEEPLHFSRRTMVRQVKRPASTRAPPRSWISTVPSGKEVTELCASNSEYLQCGSFAGDRDTDSEMQSLRSASAGSSRGSSPGQRRSTISPTTVRVNEDGDSSFVWRRRTVDELSGSNGGSHQSALRERIADSAKTRPGSENQPPSPAGASTAARVVRIKNGRRYERQVKQPASARQIRELQNAPKRFFGNCELFPTPVGAYKRRAHDDFDTSDCADFAIGRVSPPGPDLEAERQHKKDADDSLYRFKQIVCRLTSAITKAEDRCLYGPKMHARIAELRERKRMMQQVIDESSYQASYSSAGRGQKAESSSDPNNSSIVGRGSGPGSPVAAQSSPTRGSQPALFYSPPEPVKEEDVADIDTFSYDFQVNVNKIVQVLGDMAVSAEEDEEGTSRRILGGSVDDRFQSNCREIFHIRDTVHAELDEADQRMNRVPTFLKTQKKKEESDEDEMNPLQRQAELEAARKKEADKELWPWLKAAASASGTANSALLGRSTKRVQASVSAKKFFGDAKKSQQKVTRRKKRKEREQAAAGAEAEQDGTNLGPTQSLAPLLSLSLMADQSGGQEQGKLGMREVYRTEIVANSDVFVVKLKASDGKDRVRIDNRGYEDVDLIVLFTNSMNAVFDPLDGKVNGDNYDQFYITAKPGEQNMVAVAGPMDPDRPFLTQIVAKFEYKKPQGGEGTEGGTEQAQERQRELESDAGTKETMSVMMKLKVEAEAEAEQSKRSQGTGRFRKQNVSFIGSNDGDESTDDGRVGTPGLSLMDALAAPDRSDEEGSLQGTPAPEFESSVPPEPIDEPSEPETSSHPPQRRIPKQQQAAPKPRQSPLVAPPRPTVGATKTPATASKTTPSRPSRINDDTDSDDLSPTRLQEKLTAKEALRRPSVVDLSHLIPSAAEGPSGNRQGSGVPQRKGGKNKKKTDVEKAIRSDLGMAEDDPLAATTAGQTVYFQGDNEVREEEAEAKRVDERAAEVAKKRKPPGEFDLSFLQEEAAGPQSTAGGGGGATAVATHKGDRERRRQEKRTKMIAEKQKKQMDMKQRKKQKAAVVDDASSRGKQGHGSSEGSRPTTAVSEKHGRATTHAGKGRRGTTLSAVSDDEQKAARALRLKRQVLASGRGEKFVDSGEYGAEGGKRMSISEKVVALAKSKGITSRIVAESRRKRKSTVGIDGVESPAAASAEPKDGTPPSGKSRFEMKMKQNMEQDQTPQEEDLKSLPLQHEEYIGEDMSAADILGDLQNLDETAKENGGGRLNSGGRRHNFRDQMQDITPVVEEPERPSPLGYTPTPLTPRVASAMSGAPSEAHSTTASDIRRSKDAPHRKGTVAEAAAAATSAASRGRRMSRRGSTRRSGGAGGVSMSPEDSSGGERGKGGVIRREPGDATSRTPQPTTPAEFRIVVGDDVTPPPVGIPPETEEPETYDRPSSEHGTSEVVSHSRRASMMSEYLNQHYGKPRGEAHHGKQSTSSADHSEAEGDVSSQRRSSAKHQNETTVKKSSDRSTLHFGAKQRKTSDGQKRDSIQHHRIAKTKPRVSDEDDADGAGSHGQWNNRGELYREDSPANEWGVENRHPSSTQWSSRNASRTASRTGSRKGSATQQHDVAPWSEQPDAGKSGKQLNMSLSDTGDANALYATQRGTALPSSPSPKGGTRLSPRGSPRAFAQRSLEERVESELLKTQKPSLLAGGDSNKEIGLPTSDIDVTDDASATKGPDFNENPAAYMEKVEAVYDHVISAVKTALVVTSPAGRRSRSASIASASSRQSVSPTTVSLHPFSAAPSSSKGISVSAAYSSVGSDKMSQEQATRREAYRATLMGSMEPDIVNESASSDADDVGPRAGAHTGKGALTPAARVRVEARNQQQRVLQREGEIKRRQSDPQGLAGGLRATAVTLGVDDGDSDQDRALHSARHKPKLSPRRGPASGFQSLTPRQEFIETVVGAVKKSRAGRTNQQAAMVLESSEMPPPHQQDDAEPQTQSRRHSRSRSVSPQAHADEAVARHGRERGQSAQKPRPKSIFQVQPQQYDPRDLPTDSTGEVRYVPMSSTNRPAIAGEMWSHTERVPSASTARQSVDLQALPPGVSVEEMAQELSRRDRLTQVESMLSTHGHLSSRIGELLKDIKAREAAALAEHRRLLHKRRRRKSAAQRQGSAARSDSEYVSSGGSRSGTDTSDVDDGWDDVDEQIRLMVKQSSAQRPMSTRRRTEQQALQRGIEMQRLWQQVREAELQRELNLHKLLVILQRKTGRRGWLEPYANEDVFIERVDDYWLQAQMRVFSELSPSRLEIMGVAAPTDMHRGKIVRKGSAAGVRSYTCGSPTSKPTSFVSGGGGAIAPRGKFKPMFGVQPDVEGFASLVVTPSKPGNKPTSGIETPQTVSAKHAVGAPKPPNASARAGGTPVGSGVASAAASARRRFAALHKAPRVPTAPRPPMEPRKL